MFSISDKELFKKVQVDTGGYGISWNDDLDLESEEIWENGEKICIIEELDIRLLLSEQLVQARDNVGMTQKQLSEAVGIYQGDISKIERGIGNPSVLTLQRLAEGLGMKLSIEFIPRGGQHAITNIHISKQLHPE